MTFINSNINAFYNLCPPLYLYSILVFLVVVLFIYVLLYKKLNMNLSLLSFVCFFINSLILVSFIIGIFQVYIKGITNPIYLADLSLVAQLRYLIFSIIVFFGLFFLILCKYFIPLREKLSPFLFPYLQENKRLLLYKKNEDIFGPLFYNLIEKINTSRLFCVFFYIVHFLTFIGFRVFIVYLIVKFTFFECNFVTILNFLPLSFLLWLLQFLNYYFSFYVEESFIGLQNIFDFKDIDGVRHIAFKSQILVDEGLKDVHLDACSVEYYKLEKFYIYFKSYVFCCKILSFVIAFIQICCWFYIVHYFFIAPDNLKALSGGNAVIATALTSTLKPGSSSRSYVSQVHFVKQVFQKVLNQETQGVCYKNHAVLADDAIRNPENPNEILVYGQFTKGSPMGRTSYLINNTKLFDGTSAPQRYIPLPYPMYFPHWWFKPAVVGSAAYAAENRTAIMKVTNQAEET